MDLATKLHLRVAFKQASNQGNVVAFRGSERLSERERERERDTHKETETETETAREGERERERRTHSQYAITSSVEFAVEWPQYAITTASGSVKSPLAVQWPPQGRTARGPIYGISLLA